MVLWAVIYDIWESRQSSSQLSLSVDQMLVFICIRCQKPLTTIAGYWHNWIQIAVTKSLKVNAVIEQTTNPRLVK